MRKEEKMLDFSRNRDSILHNIEVKDVETQRNSINKSHKRTSSLQTDGSFTKNKMRMNSLRNSCEKSQKYQDLSRSPNTSTVVLNKSFYEREMINLEKRKIEIEAIRSQRIAEERIINTNRPQLNQHSMKIVQKKLKHFKPIHLRSAEIIQNKKIHESKLPRDNVTKPTENNNINLPDTKGKIKIENKKLNTGDSPVTRWLNKLVLYKANHEKKIETPYNNNRRTI